MTKIIFLFNILICSVLLFTKDEIYFQIGLLTYLAVIVIKLIEIFEIIKNNDKPNQ